MVDEQRQAPAPDWLAVVTLPAEIDIASSRRLCGQLGSALCSATTVIADMTATTFCDSSGVRILLLAHEQAVTTGVELRLVVPSDAVLRALALMGADWLLPVYPSLEEALAAETGGKSVPPTRPGASQAEAAR